MTSTFKVNSLQLAYLQFCVELLDQHYQASAFECALVCALAALSHDQDCWLFYTSYMDILSKVIRIGQGFVVQHTLLLGSDSEDLFEEMDRKKAGDWRDEAVGTKTPMDWMMNTASVDQMALALLGR